MNELMKEERWFEKLRQELKTEDFSPLSWKINDRISIDPLENQDYKHQVRHVAKATLIGYRITVDQVSKANKKLLSLLSMGVNAPVLNIKSGFDPYDWNLLFKGVRLDFVDVQLEGGGITTDSIASLQDFIYSNYSQVRLNGTIHGDHTLRSWRKTLKVSEDNANAADIDIILSNLCVQIDQRCVNDAMFSAKQCSLNIPLGKSYLLNIAAVRAIRILAANIFQDHGRQISSVHVNAELDPKIYDELQERNLIKAGTAALSAYCAGADQCTLSYNSDRGEESDERITINIQHLLQLESYMDKVADPLAGSHMIGQITEKICKSAWELYQASKSNT